MDLELPSDADLKNLLKVRKYLYLPFLVVVVVVALTAVVVGPNLGKVSRLRKEIAASRKELGGLEDKSEMLESMDEEELEEKVKVLERILPSTKDVYGLLASLNGLAEENQVSLANFEVVPGSIATEAATASAGTRKDSSNRRRTAASKQSSLESLNFSLQAVGGFDSVRQFVEKIEDLQPLMKLTKVTLSDRKQRFEFLQATPSATTLINANIELDLFFVPLPERLGELGDPVFELTQKESELYEELQKYGAYEAEVPQDVSGRQDPFAPFSLGF